MKYIVVLIDGMADEPIASLGDKSPLEYANIGTINSLASKSELGMVHTIPVGMAPGSDVANLSIMGYAPDKYHTGRSPLEAANIGIPMSKDDVIFRCNLVTVSEDEAFQDKIMIDHSASDISNEEAQILMDVLRTSLNDSERKFYDGTSYRNILVWENGHLNVKLQPPHDFLEQTLEKYIPTDEEWIWEFEKKSFDILNKHAINIDRRKRGLNPANMIWIWGEGKKPKLDLFEDLYGLKGATISAVDLIKGIGRCAGMEAIEVDGATGTIHTNFKGKAEACLHALNTGTDFVYLHLEATDESSHQGNLDEKIKAIEIIDKVVVKYLIENLDEQGQPYKMMILPDHPTPIRTRTHTSEPVPYLIYDSENEKKSGPNTYNEKSAESTGNSFETGPSLTAYFLDQ